MVTLNKEQFESGIGVIRKSANEDILADINSLAQVLSQEGDNALKDSLLQECKRYQDVYNGSFKPSVDKLINVFDEAFDYTEAMEKATVGELGVSDAGFETHGLNPTSVNI